MNECHGKRFSSKSVRILGICVFGDLSTVLSRVYSSLVDVPTHCLESLDTISLNQTTQVE